jgi:hypothetical protein
MPEATYETQLHLNHIGVFSRELAQKIGLHGTDPGTGAGAAGFRLKGECIQCGIRITEEELLLLGQEKTAGETDPRIERLRLGYCARNGCDSIFYRVSARANAPIEWSKYFPEPNSHLSDPANDGLEVQTTFAAGTKLFNWRVLAAGLTLLTLILVRQYYRGGTIPFIREPEEFKVDRVGARL